MKDNYRVQSVDRAVDVLEALIGASEGLTVSTVAERVGGSKSAVFATVQTLTERGLVRSVGQGMERRYYLGLRLAYLGEQALEGVSVREVAMPYLRKLTDETGLDSRVAMNAQNHVVPVGRVDGPGGIRFDLHMGKREYLHSSSVGKAILATMADAEVARLMRTVPFVKRTKRTIGDLETLLDDLRSIRERGFAVDDEEDAYGVICIGAPLRDHSEKPVGAISVTRLRSGFSVRDRKAIGLKVARTAWEIEKALGYRGEPFGPSER